MIVPPLLHHQHAWRSSLRIHYGVISLLAMILPIIQSWRICDEDYTFQGCERHTDGKLRNAPKMNHYIPMRRYRYCKKKECMQWLKLGLISSSYCALFMPSLLSVVGKRVLWHTLVFSQNTRKNEKSTFHLCSNVTQQAFSGGWTNTLPSSLQNT